jgi:XTP/dITP diphosphohydrolase
LRFLLATKNKGKLAELEAVLGDQGVEFTTLADFEDLPDVVEDGRTFAENALKKAAHFSSLTGMQTIADDSGLAVDALDGEPGVHSARYAPSDAERIDRLLRELSIVEAPEDRAARFVCAICLFLSPDRQIEVEASVSGVITDLPRGNKGFGYDPIFFYPPMKKTFAELSREEKNRVSHRARALEKLKGAMEQMGWEP